VIRSAVNNPWIIAFGLLLLMEGVVPFLFPKQWRETFQRILQLSDGQIRFIGLAALLAGLLLLALADQFKLFS
jgi:uncharacterized protein YjeT (DUF2065 family)